MIDFILLILIYFIFLYKRFKNNLLLNTIFYIYIVFVLYFTLMPFIIDFNNCYINLVPFIDVINSNGDFIRQILLNILMLIPFGIMLPYIYKTSFKQTILYGILFSLSIELLQLASNINSTDITDLITNTSGTLIGYIIFLLFKSIIKIKVNKNNFYKLSRKEIIYIGIIIIFIFVRSFLHIFY